MFWYISVSVLCSGVWALLTVYWSCKSVLFKFQKKCVKSTHNATASIISPDGSAVFLSCHFGPWEPVIKVLSSAFGSLLCEWQINLEAKASSKWRGEGGGVSHPAHALNRFSLRVRQYGTTPGRNLHLNGLILLTGSQFVKKKKKSFAMVFVWHCC